MDVISPFCRQRGVTECILEKLNFGSFPFHFLYIKKPSPEHYYLGPLDLFFLTPMKPEGHLCSGVQNAIFFYFNFDFCM